MNSSILPLSKHSISIDTYNKAGLIADRKRSIMNAWKFIIL